MTVDIGAGGTPGVGEVERGRDKRSVMWKKMLKRSGWRSIRRRLETGGGEDIEKEKEVEDVGGEGTGSG